VSVVTYLQSLSSAERRALQAEADASPSLPARNGR